MTTVAGSPPLDILIHTSGVKRLSDFLLWQVSAAPQPFHTRSHHLQCCENTQLQFTATFWPDFGLWDFLPVILDYQRKVWAQ